MKRLILAVALVLWAALPALAWSSKDWKRAEDIPWHSIEARRAVTNQAIDDNLCAARSRLRIDRANATRPRHRLLNYEGRMLV